MTRRHDQTLIRRKPRRFPKARTDLNGAPIIQKSNRDKLQDAVYFLLDLNAHMKRILRKSIVITLAGFSVGLILFLGWLDDYYYRTRPRQPDPVSGRIFPENVKGTTGAARVYLTRTEIFPFRYFEYFLLPAAAAAALLESRWRTFRNARDDVPKKLY